MTYDSNYSMNSIVEISLLVFVIGDIIYEIGQIHQHNFDLYAYLDSWNVLDIITLGLLFLWAIFLTNPNYRSSGEVMLCLSAIPLSLRLLQCLCLFKQIGQLIIMIRAMIKDIASFFIVYLVCTLGFTVTLSGLYKLIISSVDDFNGTSGFSSFIVSLLSLYSATLGNFNLEIDTQNTSVKSLMIFLICVYLLTSSG